MRAHKQREFAVIGERDEVGYYVGTVPGLSRCHTQARTLNQLMRRIREAIELCLEVQTEGGGRFEFMGAQQIAV